MKKLSVIAVLVAVGLVGGFAFAKSMSVPWFVDNAPAAAFYPPTTGTMAIIYLHNNLATPKECTIQYFNENGIEMVLPPGGNTFTIPALSTVAFRPVADDPSSVPGGQESPVAQAIPNRPTTDGKKNGALVVAWQGEATDVQGILQQGQYISKSAAQYVGKLDANLVTSYATLLPPGGG